MDGKIPERNDKTAERKAFKVISDTAFTVFTVTGLQEKNPKSHSSFQKNQKMSPNCIVLRTLTWTSHVFHKGENRVFRTLSAPVTRIELSTARAASGESDANWPPTSIFYLVFLRNCQFQNHENQASTQKEPISISTKKKQHPPGCSCLLFLLGMFSTHRKRVSYKTAGPEWSKLPLHLRSCRGIAFCQRAAMQDRKDWVHQQTPKKTHGKSLEIWGFY